LTPGTSVDRIVGHALDQDVEPPASPWQPVLLLTSATPGRSVSRSMPRTRGPTREVRLT
jgi:hypothetical protein